MSDSEKTTNSCDLNSKTENHAWSIDPDSGLYRLSENGLELLNSAPTSSWRPKDCCVTK